MLLRPRSGPQAYAPAQACIRVGSGPAWSPHAGSQDPANRQDPRPHLELWSQTTSLQYKVLMIEHLDGYNATLHNIVNTTTNTTTTTSNNQQHHILDAHHALVNRQRLFMQACTRQIKQQWHVHWTAFVDSDEFVTFSNHHAHDNDNDDNNSTTVAAALATWRSVENWTTPACYTMPRLRYGNLENITCTNVPKYNNYSSLGWNIAASNLTTLRFVQHARFDDFQANKFGKALVNVSAIPDDAIPWNVHRPYKEYCVRPIIVHAHLRVNHYTGTAARFLGRGTADVRRTAAIYQQLSRYSSQHSCDDVYMQTWVSRFVQAASSPTMAQRLLQGDAIL